MDNYDGGRLEADFERMAVEDDDTAARKMLTSGMPIHIARDDTPAGHVIRVYPDGREELVRVDREAAAKILGR
ncbi:hypothetical protein [Sphingomonas oryzagri]